MATTCAYEFQIKHFGFTDATAEDFYVSQWFSNRLGFLIYKAVIFIYWTSWIIYATIYYVNLEDIGFRYPFYLSHWGEWTNVLYFGLTFAVAMYGFFTRHRSTKDYRKSKCNTGDLRWFHHLCWVARASAVSVSYLITIVFWTFNLENNSPHEINIHRHAINSVLITMDLFMDRVPVRLLHFVYISLYGLIYTLYTVFLHLGGVRSRFYDVILNWKRIPGVSAGVTVGVMFVAVPLLHSVAFGIYHLRAFIARSCGCHGIVTSSTEQVQCEGSPSIDIREERV